MTQLQNSEAVSSLNGDRNCYADVAKPSRGSYTKLFVGIGLGMAIALLGSRLIPSPPASSEAADESDVAAQVSAQTVTVAPVQVGPVTEQLTVMGTVQPADLLEVTPQVSGLQIRDVLVAEGDRVTAGQPLVQLDDTELRTRMQQATAQIEVAQAQVQQEMANLAQAEATLAEANANLKRYQSLASQGAVSAEELDSRATQAVTAQESVGVAQASVASAQATVRSRQLDLSQLQTQLGYTTVTAPAAGVIAERPATVGDVSSTASAVITLIRDNQLELIADVPQAQLAQVQVGAPTIVTSSTDPAIRVNGTVQEIQPLVDPQTRTAQVVIQLPASDRLRSGMFLTAEMQTAQRSGLTLPAPALLPQPDGTLRVYVLGPDDTAIARTVEVGARIANAGDDASRVEVVSGLAAGDQVIVAGASYVQAGDLVTVAE